MEFIMVEGSSLCEKTALKKSLIYSFITALGVVILVFWVTLWMNDGRMVFTIDDPYIHLALAENIMNGHYGINLDEFSAPSSSILWPFIIAPMTLLTSPELAIIFINLIFFLSTLFLTWKLILPDQKIFFQLKSTRLVFWIVFGITLSICVLGANLVQLIFLGMEHSLQVFVCVLILYGLVNEQQNKKVRLWFWIALAIAPLVRYECLSLSFPVLVYLFLRGYRLKSIMVFLITMIAMVAFSYFLHLNGHKLLPSSIMAKSGLEASSVSLIGAVQFFYHGMKAMVNSPAGIVSVAFIFMALDKKRRDESRYLAVIGFFAIFLFSIFGGTILFSRRGVYTLISIFLLIFYLNKDFLYSFLFAGEKIKRRLMIACASIILLLGGFSGFHFGLQGIAAVPLGSNNIYEQQYNMNRFVTEFYKKPVAVNDLGWVAYQNDHYVLDLWGLGSIESLEIRKNPHIVDQNWMDFLVKKKKVPLAMIYTGWFEKIPQNWVLVAELHLTKYKVSPSRKNVDFYATDCSAIDDIYASLEEFEKVLKPGMLKIISKEKTSCQLSQNFTSSL